MAPRTIILTGERGAGKSSVCQKTIALAQGNRYTCGGLLTLGHPNGTLDVLDVRSGDVRRLTLETDVRPAAPSTPLGPGSLTASPAVLQGRFCFDLETLTWGCAALAQATPCQLLVVDELGPLEIERGEGWLNAFDVLHGTDFALAIVVVRPELVAQAQLKLPASAAAVFTVTLDSRDSLPATFLEILAREVRSKSEAQPFSEIEVPEAD